MATLAEVQQLFKEASDVGNRIMLEEKNNPELLVARLRNEHLPLLDRAAEIRDASGFNKHMDGCR